MNEILWTDAFGDGKTWSNTNVPYNGRDLSRDAAKALAEELQAKLQAIRSEVEACIAGTKSMYVKFTAGKLAGSIARVVKLPTFKINIENNRLRQEKDPGKVEIIHEDNWGRSTWRLRGSLFLASNTYQPKVSDYEMIQCEIDGKVVLEFNCRTASMKSARPVLLIGYNGPTFLHKGPVAKVEPTIKDRYNREVKKGDLAIIGRGSSGMLMVGKITSISDKRTVKLKHIGSTEEASITNVRDDQVLLLSDDLKAVLMVEKLKTL
jgi:hypothetical protein